MRTKIKIEASVLLALSLMQHCQPGYGSNVAVAAGSSSPDPTLWQCVSALLTSALSPLMYLAGSGDGCYRDAPPRRWR